jgi:hypothetical protein
MKISPLPPVQPTGFTALKVFLGGDPVNCRKLRFSRLGRGSACADHAKNDSAQKAVHLSNLIMVPSPGKTRIRSQR